VQNWVDHRTCCTFVNDQIWNAISAKIAELVFPNTTSLATSPWYPVESVYDMLFKNSSVDFLVCDDAAITKIQEFEAALIAVVHSLSNDSSSTIISSCLYTENINGYGRFFVTGFRDFSFLY